MKTFLSNKPGIFRFPFVGRVTVHCLYNHLASIFEWHRCICGALTTNISSSLQLHVSYLPSCLTQPANQSNYPTEFGTQVVRQ